MFEELLVVSYPDPPIHAVLHHQHAEGTLARFSCACGMQLDEKSRG